MENPHQTGAHTGLLKSLLSFPIGLQKIYPRSFSSMKGLIYGLVRTPEGKQLAVLGENALVLQDPFEGKCHHHTSTLKICDLSPENTEPLMALFPYTKPLSLRKHSVTMGTGDRLGLANPGHIRAIRKFQVRPVLAQQCPRENRQTGRNFEEVIHDAAWSVFQENYQGGYGADGNHLKSLQEVENALRAGVSMVTLDLSEKLHLEALQASQEEIDRKFREEIDEKDAEVLSHLFLNKEFPFKIPHGGFAVQFDEGSLKRNVLLFHKAIDFTEEVYNLLLLRSGGNPPVDFEISIDYAPFPTSPENHLFLVIELNYRSIHIDSFAPRFVGEFPKGINYRGNLKDFREQFYQHVMIARDFGNYKISIHSGSDKFALFPMIGEIAQKGLHLKTSGTSWLEAMRLVALVEPTLYRAMHQFALSFSERDSSHYPVTADLGRIPQIGAFQDQNLSSLMEHEDWRQFLHVAYGYLLNARGEDGKHLFRDRFFQLMMRYEEDYWSLIERQIENHLNSLGAMKGEL